AASDIIGAENPTKHFNQTLGKKDAVARMREARTRLSQDETGAALAGYRNSAIDSILKKASTTGEGLTYHRLDNYLKDNRRALSEIFEPEQMRVMDEVLNSLRGRSGVRTRGAGIGSPTIEKGANLGQILLTQVAGNIPGKFLSKIPG